MTGWRASILAGVLLTLSANAAIPDNDASCDVALLPAATLLLPYFEVDLLSEPGQGETSIFTITNVGNLPQAAKVTLWTDLAYPVIDFPIYLTGYDVQSINLYDVIGGGRIAPDRGTGADVSPVGELSGTTNKWDFDNPLLKEFTCVDLPVDLPRVFIDLMQQAFTLGKHSRIGPKLACENIGGTHVNAVGYATIDVVGVCSTTVPNQPTYFANEIRYDNVLIGDYVQFNGKDRVARGGPMVHIRAIPEGSTPQLRRNDPAYRVDLPRTFYSRFQPPDAPRLDARQPLPAVFAARWIDGGPTAFSTHFKIWREGREEGTACAAFARNRMHVREIVRFDENENPETFPPPVLICTPPSPIDPVMPATSLINVNDEFFFPPNTQDTTAGWMYLNLDYCDRDDFAGQNWVVASMSTKGLYAVDISATALGNGCSAPVGVSEATGSGGPIGPAPKTRP